MFLLSRLPPRTYVSSPSFWFVLVCFGYQRSQDISDIALVAWPSSARPDLSLKDEEVKRKLVNCASRAYSDLIRSDILGSSGARPTRLHFLRSSPLSVMKPPVPKSSSPSILEPLTAKPTRGELSSRLEVLAKKKRSSELARGLPPYSGYDPKGGGLSLAFIRRRGWRLFGEGK